MPNYNPLLLADISQFEERKFSREADAVRSDLVRLREMVLEMTPVGTYDYLNGNGQFTFRIGVVPCNLQNYGEAPLKGRPVHVCRRTMVDSIVLCAGEVCEFIVDYVEERLEGAEKLRKVETARRDLEVASQMLVKDAEAACSQYPMCADADVIVCAD